MFQRQSQRYCHICTACHYTLPSALLAQWALIALAEAREGNASSIWWPAAGPHPTLRVAWCLTQGCWKNRKVKLWTPLRKVKSSVTSCVFCNSLCIRSWSQKVPIKCCSPHPDHYFQHESTCSEGSQSFNHLRNHIGGDDSRAGLHENRI